MDSVTNHERDLTYTDFVERHWPALYRSAFLLTGDHQRAEDVVQTALMKVYLRWPRVSAMDRPEAYARTVIVNQLTSWWRRRSSRESPALTLVEPRETTQPSFDDQVVQARAMWAHVLALPPQQRAVVVLRYYEDRSEAEIAEILKVSPGSVKSHAHHALASLRSRLASSSDVGSVESRDARRGRP